MGAGRTHRYILISAPQVMSIITLNWGLRQLLLSLTLTMKPVAFASVSLGSRPLLDVHIWAVFSHRTGLQWARKETLVPTSTSIYVLVRMLLAENASISIITYSKVPPAAFSIYVAWVHLSSLQVTRLPVVRILKLILSYRALRNTLTCSGNESYSCGSCCCIYQLGGS